MALIHKTNQLINDISFLIIGILLSAILLLFLMRFLNVWGLVFGVLTMVTAGLYCHRKKIRPFGKRYLHLMLRGAFWFSILISIFALITFILFYSVLQNLIS